MIALATATTMMSESNDTAARSMLEELKQPWFASSITDTQRQRRDDQTRAKEIWDGMMTDFRQRKAQRAAKAAANDGDHDDDKEDDSAGQFFPFMDFPAEIRNLIYDFTLEDDKQERRERIRDRDTQYGRHQGLGSRCYPVLSSLTKRAKEKRMLSPTHEQKQEEGQLKRIRNRLAERHLKRASEEAPLTAGCSEAFERYRLEHDMYTSRCPHEEHEEDNLVVPVNARGNLCDDLPLFSLVNRQIFHDTFYLFYSTKREGLWFRWTVRNLDFFPFLRFWKSLTSGPSPLEIKPSEFHVAFDDEDEGKDKALHVTKFKNVHRLIEMHWLEGFPLWGCLTGFTDYDSDRGPFFDWMYSVRQIVALYRIDRQAWREQSIKYLQMCQPFDRDEATSNIFSEMSDAELVEAVIEWICNAIEYNLGYDGNFSTVGRDGKEWDKDAFKVF
jgi:hypothetical protein